MESNKKLYTLIVHSENRVGLLSQVTAVFTRRQINIESLNVSASSIDGVHRYTITTYTDKDSIVKVVNQIEKIVDVLRCAYYTDDEIFMKDVALYKVSTSVLMSHPEMSQIIRKYQATITEVNPTYIVVEKTGKTEDIINLNKELSAAGGTLQYVSSGRIAITKAMMERVSEYIDKVEKKYGKCKQ